MFRRPKPPENAPRQALRTLPPRNQQKALSYRAIRRERDDNAERQLESVQQRQRQVQSVARRRTKVVVLSLVIILFFICITWLNPTPHVDILGTPSQQSLLQNSSVYEQAAARLLATSPANHNKLTLDANGIAAKLEADYPELASVSVQSPVLGDHPQIYVAPAAPVLRLSTTSGTTFLLAASGKALAPVGSGPVFSGVSLPLVADKSGLVVHTGTGVLPSSDVEFIQTIVEQLLANNLKVTSLTLPQGTSELDATFSAKTYYLKFNLEGSAPEQVGTFLATYKYLVAKNVTPAQYMDLRVPGRAYYK
jgi:hypothetical protein